MFSLAKFNSRTIEQCEKAKQYRKAMSQAEYNVKPPTPLVVRSGNVGNNWRIWRQQYELFEIANQMKAKPADVQVATFMLSIGAEATVIFNTFDLSVIEPASVSTIKTLFQNHFIPHSNTSWERYRFNKMVQEECESFNDFLTKIQSQSNKCEFGDAHDSLIIDKIIVGVRNDLVREKLLSDADLTLGRAIQVCRENELASEKPQMNESSETNAIIAANTTTKSDSVTFNTEKFYNVLNEILNQTENIDETQSTEYIYPNLNTINEDCLRHIVQYIDIVSAVHLAVSCRRLMNFCKAVIFPKKAKTIYIYVPNDGITVNLLTALGNKHLVLKPESLFWTYFSYIGEFVEVLVFCVEEMLPLVNDISGIWFCLAIVLEHCKYLKTLSFKNCNFKLHQTHELQYRIGRLQNLKELQFFNCARIPEKWGPTFNEFNTVNKITLDAANKISGHFFTCFRNLTSLTITLTSVWASDLAKIFKSCGHCLKYLELYSIKTVANFESIGVLINESNMLRLETLKIDSDLTNLNYILLPHLMFLIVTFQKGSVNLLLRKLVNHGKIENLTIYNFVFRHEEENAEPLIFNKLQRLYLRGKRIPRSLLQLMTRSRMPAIQSVALIDRYPKEGELDDVLKFVESKANLKCLRLCFLRKTFCFDPNLYAFLREMIEILKVPCTLKRPFLNLELCRVNVVPTEAVSKIAKVHI